jgi:hypothetical protein
MNTQLAQRLLTHDEQDAARIVEAAMAIAALPGFVSAAARDAAAVRIRELSSLHPRQAEVFAAIVSHIEGYS